MLILTRLEMCLNLVTICLLGILRVVTVILICTLLSGLVWLLYRGGGEKDGGLRRRFV